MQDKTRGSGWDTSKSTQAKSESERTVVASNSQPLPLLPHRQPQKPVSVQATKNFFETKASQNQSVPLPPASAALVATGVTVSGPQPSVRSQSRPTHLSSVAKTQTPRKKDLDTALRPSSLPHDSERAEAAPLIEKPGLLEAGEFLPDVVVRRATTQYANPSATREQTQIEEHAVTGRRRSTNIFTDNPHNATPSHFEQLSTVDVENPIATDKLHRTEPRRSSEETVKRHRTRSSSSTTELKSLEVSETNRPQRKVRRSKSAHDHRRASEKPTSASPQRLRRQNSRSAPLNNGATRRDQALRRADRRSPQSSGTDMGISQNHIEAPNDVRQKIDAIAARGLSHDGSGSLHDVAQHSSSSSPVPIADIGVQKDYHDVEVPHHVDWRGAYGRRKTQDFGFPGARIKPRSTPRSHKPLQDPGTWVKRACGHFSYMGKGEGAEVASRKVCRQCHGKAISSVMPQPARNSHSRHQVVTDISTSSSSFSTSFKSFGARDSRRRQRHSECIPNEKCGDVFAKDLGFIIDAILEEHTSTLQGVISNIKRSQPSLAQLRRVSQDLIQRSQSTGICTNVRHKPCFPPCTHQTACQHVCQPLCKPQVCEWTPTCPYVPPKATEKLNVGSPGQLVPNLNDSRASLHESVKSIPGLVELVNSAADDLGLDLDRRPTTKDNQIFEDAPYEKTPRGSISSRHSDPLDVVHEGMIKEEQYAEDPWLQQTRRHLTELSEARTQLMDELDSIAEDLGVQLQDRRVSEARPDPIQRVLSKINAGISRRSTRLRNKSVDSVTEEIPKMIDEHTNERRLSRVLTRISSQSRRMSEITQNMQEIGEIPPEAIQEWLEVAQTELPAAIDSITTVLETLPALGFESSGEPDEQLQFEQDYGPPDYPGLESQYEEEEHALYEDYAESPPRRTYTAPISDLQDRIADLERRLGNDSIRAISPELEEHEAEFAGETMALPIQSVATKTSTYPSSQSFMLRQQADRERSFPSEPNDIEEVVEPTVEPETPPAAERTAPCRTSTIEAAHPDMQPERTFSFVSPESSEPEQYPYIVPPELTDMRVEVPWRHPTRRKTSVVQSPVQSLITSKAVPPRGSPGTSSLSSSITSNVQSEDRRIVESSRKTTHSSTWKARAPDDSEASNIKMARLISQPFRVQTPPDAEITSEAPVLVATRTVARDSCRPSIRSPSPILEETIEELPRTRLYTRLPTRQKTHHSVMDVTIEPPEDMSDETMTGVRRIATQPLSTPEPEPEGRVIVKRPTGRTPSSEAIAGRKTTRKKSESVEAPPAPPSSPSTEAETMLPSHAFTSRQEESVFVEGEGKEPVRNRESELSLIPESLTPELLQQSSLSDASELSLAHAIGESPNPEEVIVPAHMIRQPPTVQESQLDEIRKPSFRSSPSMKRIIIGPTRQSTVAERRATFEDASNISMRTDIISDPMTVDTSSKQPPLFSRASTGYVLRKPTRRMTEPEHIRLPASRYSNMSDFEAASQRGFINELPGSIQGNVEESGVEVASTITRQTTREISDKAGSPSISRKVITHDSRSVSRSASVYSLSEQSGRNLEMYSDNFESKLLREATQQPATVTRNLTRRATQQNFKDSNMGSRRGTRQNILPREPDSISDVGNMPSMSIRQGTERAAVLQFTQIQTKDKSSEFEAIHSSSSSSLESQPVSYRVSTDHNRKMMKVERNETLPREPQETVTGSKTSIIVQNPIQHRETRPSGYTGNFSTEPAPEQSELVDEAVGSPSEIELGTIQEIQSHPLSRPRTLTLRADSRVTPSRKTTWSTEAVLEEELPATIRSRKTTALSRRSTGQPPDIALQEIPMAVERHPTTISRRPTRFPIDLPVPVETSPDSGLEHKPTHLSRRPTRAATVPMQRYAVQQKLEPGTEVEPTRERGSRTNSIPSSLLEESSTAPDTYSALSLKYTDLLSEESPTVAQRKITARESPGSYPSSPPPGPPSQQPTIAVRQPDTPATDSDHSAEIPLVAKTIEPPAGQQFKPALGGTPEEEPGRIDRPSTADLSREPGSLAPPLPQRFVEAPTMYSSPSANRQTRVDPDVDERVPRVLTVPREGERRQRSAALVIEASPPGTKERESQPNLHARKSKKVPNYPPEQQYPRAPAYPPRETPSWTRPDTQTPPLKPNTENPPKKHRFRGWGSKPKTESVQRLPEPYRDRDTSEPFRHAAPGPVPGPPGGTLQRPRGNSNRPGNPTYHRSPAPIPIRRDDYPSRQAPIYARKDDYYPRLTPIVRDRRDDYNRPQSAPIRRDVRPQYPRVQAPIRRDYPTSARREYPAPNYAPPSRDYPQAQPRARSAAPHRSEPRQQPLRRYTPEPARRQPQAQPAFRNQEKVPLRSKTPPSQRRSQAHEEPSRTREAPQSEDFHRPTRHDARPSTPKKETVTRTEGDPHRSGERPAASHEIPRVSQKASQSGGRDSGRPRQRQETIRTPSKLPETPDQKPHKQSQEQDKQSPSRDNELSGAESREDTRSGELSGSRSTTEQSQDERSTPAHESVDGASGRPSLETQREPFATGTAPRQAGAKSSSGAARRSPNQGHRRRSSSTRPEEETTIARAISRQATAPHPNEKRTDEFAKSVAGPKNSTYPRPTSAGANDTSDPNAAPRPRTGGNNLFGEQRAPAQAQAKRTPSIFGRGKAQAESTSAQNAGQGAGKKSSTAKGQQGVKGETENGQGPRGNPPKGRWGWGRGWGRG